MLIAFLDVVTHNTWHLEGLNSMSHWDSHNDSLFRSFCSTVPPSKPPIVRYTPVSSAKSHTCDDSFSGRAFMKTRNRIGPKTEPWGILELTRTDPDSSPSITTVCDLLPRKARIQDSAFPLIPYWCSFQMSFGWLTLSEAFEKSSSIRSVCLPVVVFLARSSNNTVS